MVVDTTKNSPVKKPAEQEFEAGFESMRQGFKGTLDQLVEYLANESAK
jgi:hypothetical protein